MDQVSGFEIFINDFDKAGRNDTEVRDVIAILNWKTKILNLKVTNIKIKIPSRSLTWLNFQEYKCNNHNNTDACGRRIQYDFRTAYSYS